MDAGVGKPPDGDPRWYPLYDQVCAAGESLWIRVGGNDSREAIDRADAIVRRYGPDGLCLIFPEMTEAEGRNLLRKAEQDWG